MNNDEVIKAYEIGAEFFNIALGENLEKTKAIEKENERLHESFLCANRVTEIYEGVAIEVRPFGPNRLDVFAVGEDFERYAYIYKNAHNNKTWGLTVYAERGPRNDVWKGKDWKTKKAVLEAAKRWVVLNEEPSHDGVEG